MATLTKTATTRLTDYSRCQGRLLVALSYCFFDHFVERRLDFGLKVRLHFIHVGELRKSPAPIVPMVVHSRHPVRVHGIFLCLRVFPFVPLYLHDEIQEIVLPPAIVNEDDKIGDVGPHCGAVAVWHLQPEIVVLGKCFQPWMGFSAPAELGLPIAVQDHPVDVTTMRVRFSREIAVCRSPRAFCQIECHGPLRNNLLPSRHKCLRSVVRFMQRRSLPFHNRPQTPIAPPHV